MADFEYFKASIREDEIRDRFLDSIGINIDNRYGIDCYSKNILFEFKYDKNIVDDASALAQCIFYERILREKGDEIPSFICVVNINNYIVFESEIFEDLLDINELFPKTSCPSDPSNQLVKECALHLNENYLKGDFNSESSYQNAIRLIKQILKNNTIKQEKINIHNVRRAHRGYIEALGDYILEKSKSNGANEFRVDAIGKASLKENIFGSTYDITFKFDQSALLIEDVPKIRYDQYWSQWKRINDDYEATIVFSKIYDFYNLHDRRTKGQFYTPNNLANYAWDRLIKQFGDNFWLSGKYRIWDCCCGTGNLEYEILPESIKQYVYLSTLDIGEVDILKQKFPLPTCVFRFDFLEDSFDDKKLPKRLYDDINNPEIKFIFFINPPYAQSSNIEKNVTSSATQRQMVSQGQGQASRDLFTQFMFNIENIFKNKYYLAMFSPATFIVSKKYLFFQQFLKQPKFLDGFIIKASDFFVDANDFPILFTILDRTEKYNMSLPKKYWNTLDFKYDIIDKELNIVDTKKLYVYDEEISLKNNFISSFESGNNKKPIITSGFYQPKPGKKIYYTNQYVSDDFLGTMKFISPNFEHQNDAHIGSGIINSNHNDVFITKRNYIKVLISFALYKAPEENWLNNKDVFHLPNRELTDEEKSDCLLYSLLIDSNKASTFQFENGDYMENYFNPFDESLFDFTHLSITGRKAFNEMSNYLNNIVDYKNINTPFGKGKFMGFYQYKSDPKINNTCYGFKYPESFKNAIEELKQVIAKISYEVCLK